MKKVLLVEDSPFMSRLYEKVFTLEKFQVVMAANGKEGLVKAKEEKPAIILLDMMMPEMNGLEVLDSLKKDSLTKAIPVVMLSNIAGDQDARIALEKGAEKYIVKSDHEPQDIVKMIREILQNPRN